jgi:heat shock protein HslJ
MNHRLDAYLCALALLAVFVPAGAQDKAAPPPAALMAESSQPATANGVPEVKQSKGTHGRKLAGTSWRLVKIMSMDDSVHEPDDPSKYTLDFRADGTAAILADCNRGTGTWTSASAAQLQFGPIAATKALCPPGSLSEWYLAQFQWVRSYVMENGHLYLATMADGSIIELAPMELPLAATVLGEEVRTSDAKEMQRIVLTRLFDRYAEEEGIEVTEAEIDTYVDNLRRGMRAPGLTAEDDLTPEEAAEVEQMHRDMGRAMIRQWKLNRALYRQYGGRILFQQLGPEPLDAYRQYLEERQAAGDFAIHEKTSAYTFWRYFTDESMHSFYESGSEEEARAFATPPWERKVAAE